MLMIHVAEGSRQTEPVQGDQHRKCNGRASAVSDDPEENQDDIGDGQQSAKRHISKKANRKAPVKRKRHPHVRRNAWQNRACPSQKIQSQWHSTEEEEYDSEDREINSPIPRRRESLIRSECTTNCRWNPDPRRHNFSPAPAEHGGQNG
jgi:hypothetical protein